jgi:hypothetical protein
MLRKLILLGTVASLLLTAEAKDIPTGQTVDVTGIVTLEGKDPVLSSSDTLVDGRGRHPIKGVWIWVLGDNTNSRFKTVMQAAKTGTPVTLHGYFKWKDHVEHYVFEIPD